MYEEGLGVSKDTDIAITWYLKAAAQGYATAQYNLGVAYEKGKGVTKNNVQSAEWYRKAAQDHLQAQKKIEKVGRDPELSHEEN